MILFTAAYNIKLDQSTCVTRTNKLPMFMLSHSYRDLGPGAGEGGLVRLLRAGGGVGRGGCEAVVLPVLG